MKQLRWAATSCALSAGVLAQSYDFALDPTSSTTSIAASAELALPSSAIGNYDAAANPTGTITCTSLFGACNNTSIPMSIDLLTDTSFSGVPSGGFRAVIDETNGVISLSNLAIDALGGQSGTTDLTLELLYSTFRTAQPASLYIGGITLPLPLGQAVASNVSIAQLGGPAFGTLTPSGIPHVYDVAAAVPVSLSFDIELLGNTTPIGPIPLVLPIVGSLDSGGASPLLALFVDIAEKQTVDDPLGTQTFEDIPLDLPTILPPGETAHLLFDIDPDDLAIDLLATLEWFAGGVAVCDAQQYCVSTPNTFGAGAHIATSGSSSLALNDLALMCDGVPPFHAGRMSMGSGQAVAPLGDGILCIGGTMRRFRVVFADALGHVHFPVDVLDPTQPGNLIAAGSTWNFQLVYRDPLGGAATFNTSDAVAVTFCP